jgi:cellulose synthase (UDP-forming)
VKTWRGQQYSLALFPVWCKAVTSAFSNVFLGRPLAFAVTPKSRQYTGGLVWRLVKYQLIAAGLLIMAMIAGTIRAAAGHATTLATAVGLIWAAFDLLLLSVLIPAIRYRGSEPAKDSD